MGPAVAPSPMASMLLDPHHQPSASLMVGRTPPRVRQPRGPYQGEGDIIEESMEASTVRSVLHRQPTAYTDDGDVDESVARLGESTWEGSPRQPLSREESAATDDAADNPGVVALLKQFQDAHLNHRGGVM